MSDEAQTSAETETPEAKPPEAAAAPVAQAQPRPVLGQFVIDDKGHLHFMVADGVTDFIAFANAAIALLADIANQHRLKEQQTGRLEGSPAARRPAILRVPPGSRVRQ